MAQFTSDRGDEIEVSEEAPLLNEGVDSSKDDAGPSDAYSRKAYLVLCMCAILIVCFELGGALQLAPLNKILESIICKDYFPELDGLNLDSLDDQRCKSSDVQGALAMLRGWQSVTEIIPGLLTTVVYGFVADKHGRRIVLFVSAIGLTLNHITYAAICWFSNIFSVWLTLATPIIMFAGGGSVVAVSLVFTIVADVAPESQRANAFFIIGASSLAGDLVAAPVSSILMERNVWIPIALGISLMIGGSFGVCFMPETLNFRTGGKIPEDLETNATTKVDGETTIVARIMAASSQLATAVTWFIWRDAKIALLMLTLLLTALGRYVGELLLQYTTKKFHWTWAQAGYLNSLKALCSLLLFIVFLPAVSQILISKYSFTARAKDLWLARVSIVLVATGAFLMAFSINPSLMVFGLILFSLGSGYNHFVRSLLASMVEPHHIGTLFNTIAMLQTVGSIIAGPLLANSFKLGLELDGFWIGLPFVIGGCLVTLGAIIIWSVDISVGREIGEEVIVESGVEI